MDIFFFLDVKNHFVVFLGQLKFIIVMIIDHIVNNGPLIKSILVDETFTLLKIGFNFIFFCQKSFVFLVVLNCYVSSIFLKQSLNKKCHICFIDNDIGSDNLFVKLGVCVGGVEVTDCVFDLFFVGEFFRLVMTIGFVEVKGPHFLVFFFGHDAVLEFECFKFITDQVPGI